MAIVFAVMRRHCIDHRQQRASPHCRPAQQQKQRLSRILTHSHPTATWADTNNRTFASSTPKTKEILPRPSPQQHWSDSWFLQNDELSSSMNSFSISVASLTADSNNNNDDGKSDKRHCQTFTPTPAQHHQRRRRRRRLYQPENRLL